MRIVKMSSSDVQIIAGAGFNNGQDSLKNDTLKMRGGPVANTSTSLPPAEQSKTSGADRRNSNLRGMLRILMFPE